MVPEKYEAWHAGISKWKGDSFLNKKDFKDEPINSYGIEGGPLLGLVGTADLRLQTITLIGSSNQMKTAEKYIKDLYNFYSLKE